MEKTPRVNSPTLPGHWVLQDAKARFSELVRRVRSEGPRHVTVHVWLQQKSTAACKGIAPARLSLMRCKRRLIPTLRSHLRVVPCRCGTSACDGLAPGHQRPIRAEKAQA